MPDEETNVTFGDLDFDTIETAVMETARGRWFLKEFARRNRHADTQAIVEALSRLKEQPLDPRVAEPFRAVLEKLVALIRQTKAEVRSFPALDPDDPMNGLSEAELQEAAEQRIRRLVSTLHDVENAVQSLIDHSRVEIDRTEVTLEAGPFEGEKAQHLHPHPAFLM
ncbi:hypothetical protein HPT29_008490 [Microvirga terrae]|uniref:Uncharacterized protein n=1 Tax=Microvirga terrae TaxID=2740529 RepID=A0ABY5RVV9_9HYPH|nr:MULTISPECIES: hypothetical protein [Microvirga]MBQ0822379.1 hypothetical protein [Microvirga sp. HBU67558]UVF21143.1 hypothetical protein HPT29_008490 [Microvirga terrae]